MSTAELLTVVFGLLLGYGIISRWMGQRRSNARDAGNGERRLDPCLVELGASGSGRIATRSWA